MADKYAISARMQIEGINISKTALRAAQTEISRLAAKPIRIQNFELRVPKNYGALIRTVVQRQLDTSRPIRINNLQISPRAGLGKAFASSLNRQIKDAINAKPISLSKFIVTDVAIRSITRQIQRGINSQGISINVLGLNQRQQQPLSPSRVSSSRSNTLRDTRSLIDANRSFLEGVQNIGEQAGVTARRFAAYTGVRIIFNAVEGAIYDAVRSLIEFDKYAVRLGQTLQTSPRQVEEVTKEVRKLSTSLGVSSEELAKASVDLAQAGIPLKEIKNILGSIADTSLSPSFESIEKTTEGIIALKGQFKLSADGIRDSLNSINKVAAQYAAESSDYIEAIQRTGGTFRAAGGDVNELLAAFTAVRSTTRLSASTIANAFNTIVSRLQNVDIQNKLKSAFDIDISNAVGPLQQFIVLADKLNQLPPQQQFQALFDIAGQRQLNKIIPLIQNISLAEEAYQVSLTATNSLLLNRISAQDALGVRINKTKEILKATIAGFANDPLVNTAFDGFNFGLTTTINLVDKLNGLLPALLLGGLVPLQKSFAALGTGFFSGVTGRVFGGFFGSPLKQLNPSGTDRVFSRQELLENTRPLTFRSIARQSKLLGDSIVPGARLDVDLKDDKLANLLLRRAKGVASANLRITNNLNLIRDIDRVLPTLNPKNADDVPRIRQLSLNRQALSDEINLQKTRRNLAIQGGPNALSLKDLRAEFYGTTSFRSTLLPKIGASLAKASILPAIAAGGAFLANQDTDFLTESGKIREDVNKRAIKKSAPNLVGGLILGNTLGFSPLGIAATGAAAAIFSLVGSLKEISKLKIEKEFERLELSISETLDKVRTLSDSDSIQKAISELFGGQGIDAGLAQAAIRQQQKLERLSADSIVSGTIPFTNISLRNILSGIAPNLVNNTFQAQAGAREEFLPDLIRQLDKIFDLSQVSGAGVSVREAIARRLSSAQAELQEPQDLEARKTLENKLYSNYLKAIESATRGFNRLNVVLPAIRDSSSKFSQILSDLSFGINNINRNISAVSAIQVNPGLSGTFGAGFSLPGVRDPRTATTLGVVGNLGRSFGQTALSEQFASITSFRNTVAEILKQLGPSLTTNEADSLNANRDRFEEAIRNSANANLPEGFVDSILNNFLDEELFANIREQLQRGVDTTNIAQNLFQEPFERFGEIFSKFFEQAGSTFSKYAEILEESNRQLDAIQNINSNFRNLQQSVAQDNANILSARSGARPSPDLALRNRLANAAAIGGNLFSNNPEFSRATLNRLLGRRDRLQSELDFRRSRGIFGATEQFPNTFGETQKELNSLNQTIRNFSEAAQSLVDDLKPLQEIQNALLDVERERTDVLSRANQLFTNQEDRTSSFLSKRFIDSFFKLTGPSKGRGFDAESFAAGLRNLPDQGRRAVLDELLSNPKFEFKRNDGSRIAAKDLAERIISGQDIPGFDSLSPLERKRQEALDKRRNIVSGRTRKILGRAGLEVDDKGRTGFDNALDSRLEELEKERGVLLGLQNKFLENVRQFSQLLADIPRNFLESLNKNINQINVENANVQLGNTQNLTVPPIQGGRMNGGMIPAGRRVFGGRDSQLIAAEPGEYIVKKSVTQRHRGLLDSLNYGIPGYANGGVIRRFSGAAGLAPTKDDVAYAKGLLITNFLAGGAFSDSSQSVVARGILRKSAQDAESRKFVEAVGRRADRTLEELSRPRGPIENNFTPDTDVGRYRAAEIAKLKRDNQRISQADSLFFGPLAGIGSTALGIGSGLLNAILNPIQTAKSIVGGTVKSLRDTSAGAGTAFGGALVGDLDITKEGLRTISRNTIEPILRPGLKAIGSTIGAASGKSVTGRPLSKDLSKTASQDLTEALLFYLGLGVSGGPTLKLANKILGPTISSAISGANALGRVGRSGLSGAGRSLSGLAGIVASPISSVLSSAIGSPISLIEGVSSLPFKAAAQLTKGIAKRRVLQYKQFQYLRNDKRTVFDNQAPVNIPDRFDDFLQQIGIGATPTTPSGSLLRPDVINLPDLRNRQLVPAADVYKLPTFTPSDIKLTITNSRQLRSKFDIVKSPEGLIRLAEQRFPESLVDQGRFIVNYQKLFPSHALGLFSQKYNIGGVRTDTFLDPTISRRFARHETLHGYNKHSGLRKIFSQADPVMGRAFDEIYAFLGQYRRELKLGTLSKQDVANEIKNTFNKKNYPWMNALSEEFRDRVLDSFTSGEFSFNRGGLVLGQGDRDSRKARLTPGEFVVNRNAVAKNLGLLTRLNSTGNPNDNSNKSVVMNFDMATFIDGVKKLDAAASKLASIPSRIDVTVAPVTVSVSGLNLQNMITKEAVSKIAEEVMRQMTGEDIRRKLSKI